MNKFIPYTMMVLILLSANQAISSDNFSYQDTYSSAGSENSSDIFIQQNKDAVAEPIAFAVNVHGVIDENGVYDPYYSYTHTLNGFDNPTYVAGNPRENLRPFAITWSADKTTMYALSREDEKYLIRINPETGVSTRLSKLTGYPSNQTIQGMAIDENNTCYVVATDASNHDTSSTLYSCNLMTGAVTLVGSQSLAPDIHDIAATCEGEIYGVDASQKSLIKIDKLNGTAEWVGSLGISADVGLYSLSYDRQNGALYQYVINSSGYQTALATLSKTNGSLSFVSDAYKYGNFVGGIQSSCADKVETFALNPGFNGSWFNIATDGQGFMFDVLPESNTFFAAWFTFDADEVASNQNKVIGSAEHRWFTALGAVGDTNTVELSVYNTSGGVFDDPTAVSSQVVGSMTVKFDNCSEGTIDYSMDDGTLVNSIPIQRIAGDNVDLCESLLNAAVKN